MALPLADRAVIVAGIAGDHALPIGLLDVPAGLSDNDGKLALVIKSLRGFRRDQVLAVADLAVGEANKDDRLLRRLAPAFGDMRHVVEADAEDLFRIRDRRQQGDGIELEIGLLARVGFQRGELRERVTQAGRLGPTIDHARAVDDAPTRAPVRAAETD